MNSIRTPRRGTSATSQRIAEAVDNEDWQKFRLSMKGKSTADKITMLEDYYNDNTSDEVEPEIPLETIKIRIDNYIKALCRGGQLEAGMTFDHFNDGCIRNHIKK